MAYASPFVAQLSMQKQASFASVRVIDNTRGNAAENQPMASEYFTA